MISIDASRSLMELLDACVRFRYPNGIARACTTSTRHAFPTPQKCWALLHEALAVLQPERLWINPDCGLKTRS